MRIADHDDLPELPSPDLAGPWAERAFDRAPVGMALLRGRRVLRANATIAELLGADPAELVGLDPVALVPAHDRAGAAALFAAVAAGVEPPEQDRRLVTAGGELRHVRLSFSTLDEEPEALVLVSVTDRTAAVQAAAERQRAHRQFEASFDAAPIGMALVALDGRFLQVNPALCALLDRPEEELLVSDFQTLTHPDDLEADLELLRETLAGARTGYELRKRYLRPAGEVVDARLSVRLVRDTDGAPAHFVVQVVDLTALEHARQELAQAKGRLQAIVDHSPSAIYLRDLDHRWQVVNEEACRLLGRPADELLGRSLAETHPPALFEHLSAQDDAVVAAGTAQSFDQHGTDPETGEERHFLSLKFPVRDPDGTVVGLGGVALDMTERERMQRELAAARELFERSFQHAPIGMVISRLEPDGSSVVVECNRAFAAMTGRAPEDVVGRSGAEGVHPDDLKVRAHLIDELRAGGSPSAELRLEHRDGHDVWALVAPAIVTAADGARLVVLQAVDISERKRLEGRLQHLADHDGMTGLFTRRRFEEELGRELARLRRHGAPACLLLLDLDGFKAVNDRFGHRRGDALLARIGGALQHTLRAGDVVARIGGDEFAALLPATGVEDGRILAERLLAAVRAAGVVEADGLRVAVGASIGLTCINGEGAAEDLLAEADAAMYRAKAAGRGRVVVAAPRSAPAAARTSGAG